jgi:hypothetical protein
VAPAAATTSRISCSMSSSLPKTDSTSPSESRSVNRFADDGPQQVLGAADGVVE